MTSFDLIRMFLAVAEQRSFTEAARRLQVSPTAVSKGVRTLERQHDVVLFRRTTRSVSLTEAGASLLAALKPALAQVEDAFVALGPFRDRPGGRLRLTMPRSLGWQVARELVPRMRTAYPEIAFDLTLDDAKVDLVAEGYDAGIRLGQSVAQDMVAIRLSRDLSWSIVAAPRYLEQHGLPATPRALMGHRTIRYRFPGSGLLHAWHFVEGGETYQLETDTGLVANDTRMIAEWARQGLGCACLPDLEIAQDLAQGSLVRILASCVASSSGLFLYFPARTQQQPAMRALVDQVRSLAARGVFDGGFHEEHEEHDRPAR